MRMASKKPDLPFPYPQPPEKTKALPGRPGRAWASAPRGLPLRRQKTPQLQARHSDVEGLQRREAVELHRAVAGGVGAGGEPVQTVATGQIERQAVLVVLVHDVGAVAG